jgi:hypothetical protein
MIYLKMIKKNAHVKRMSSFLMECGLLYTHELQRRKTVLTFRVQCPHKHAPQDMVSAPAMRNAPLANRVRDYMHAAFVSRPCQRC